MAVTGTLVGQRLEGHFRVDVWKVVHTTGGGTWAAEPGASRKRLVVDDDGTTVTFGDNTEYVLETADTVFSSNYEVISQANSSERFVELWYGNEITPNAAF